MGLIKRGLLEKIFPSTSQKLRTESYFKLLNGYAPIFSTFDGSVYEMELTRSAIHSKAKFYGKLKPEIQGSAYKNLEKMLQFRPNPYMNTYQYLYRLGTYLEVNTYAFIIPLYTINEQGNEVISGFYPLSPQRVEIIGDKILYLRYTFSNGQQAAIEYDRVGVLSKFMFRNDFLGDGNGALSNTLNVIDMQNQGIQEAIKQSAAIRFIATVNGQVRDEDLKLMRKNFVDMNLSSENDTGLMILDARLKDITQVDFKNWVIDDKQMKLINDNVNKYFGVNDKIMMSNFNEDEFNAFYESEIEPFALQCSLAHTNMLMSDRELALNNAVMFSANRLQYASNKTKMDIINSGLDRGWLTQNQAREIMNMPSRGEQGDIYRIRLDFIEADKLNEAKGVGNGTE